MRLWSIHPKYLDRMGLVALWRESLLAKNVLEGRTVGYKNHPQLNRFKECDNPILAINKYMEAILTEANERGYSFDYSKITFTGTKMDVSIDVTDGQIKFERNHLLYKLRTRDRVKYLMVGRNKDLDPHPIFNVVPGEIEPWEII